MVNSSTRAVFRGLIYDRSDANEDADTTIVYSDLPRTGEREISSPVTRLDSDLEAFSHNLSDGSFALLAFQPGA